MESKTRAHKRHDTTRHARTTWHTPPYMHILALSVGGMNSSQLRWCMVGVRDWRHASHKHTHTHTHTIHRTHRKDGVMCGGGQGGKGEHLRTQLLARGPVQLPEHLRPPPRKPPPATAAPTQEGRGKETLSVSDIITIITWPLLLLLLEGRAWGGRAVPWRPRSWRGEGERRRCSG